MVKHEKCEYGHIEAASKEKTIGSSKWIDKSWNNQLRFAQGIVGDNGQHESCVIGDTKGNDSRRESIGEYR